MSFAALQSLVALTLLTGGSPSADPPAVQPASDPFRQVLVQTDDSGRMVGVALRFPSGYASDPEGREGISVLLGRVLEAEGTNRLAPFDARLAIQVERDDSYVVLLTTPDRWTEAVRELTLLLTSGALPSQVTERERERLLGGALFEEGAPVRAFERESARMLLGLTAPGARDPRGTLSSLGAISVEELVRHRDAALRPGQATAAVVGPVTRAEVDRALPGPLRMIQEPPSPAVAPLPPLLPLDSLAAEEPSPVEALPPAPQYRTGYGLDGPLRPPSTPGNPAWTGGERAVRDLELTSSWIGVAYPLPRGTHPLLLSFLRHLVYEYLNPQPPQPGVYEADARIEWVNGAPVLYLIATVDPRFTGQWEDRLLSATDQLAEEPPMGSFFDLTRRRFRSALAIELAAPDNRALWLARMSSAPGAGDDRGGLPSLTRDIWRLDREGVSILARSAGPARVLLFGPVQMMER